MSKHHQYRAAGLVVGYDAKRCIHAGECARGLPEVFDPKARPWIQPDRSTAQRLADTIARCPTGALSLADEGGESLLPAPSGNEARVVADGPVYLRGDLHLCDADGTQVGQEARMALCRCGASNNKPYCDNSHQGSGFKDDGVCATAELKDLPASGPLKLTVRANGPVQCDGPLTVHDAFGEASHRTEQCWLCRCGESRNKPFCDGSHKRIGFTA